VIVVQRVVTEWSKRSRGGDAARRRAAVPRAYPLPNGRGAVAGPGPAVLVHQIMAREENDFAPQEAARIHELLPPTDILHREHIAGVFLRSDGDRVVVIGCPDPRGAPERFGHPRTLFALGRGEHSAWLVNFRFTDRTGAWYYQHWSVNVAHVEAPPAADLFLWTTPTRIVDEREYLR
jgi:hypothetical protein